ncbi:MAG: GAF domain-containing protein [Proteobacteria bacterium]|nr:GAF domain-containing protein [Pseudomonadota bacterium]
MDGAATGEAEQPRARRRDYEKVLSTLETKWKRHAPDRARRMHEIVDALWDMFGGKAYSWVGFYFPAAGGNQLILGPNRDKPACSPIGAHGVCGKAAATRTTQIVADVTALGDAYVECDPKDRSEIAVPVVGDDGVAFAVLDIDSHDVNMFNDDDRRWLERICKGLAQTPAPRHPIV